jgi:hypothetical protein
MVLKKQGKKSIQNEELIGPGVSMGIPKLMVFSIT